MATECDTCAHNMEKTETEKGHKEVQGNLICLTCGEVCRLAAQAAQATTPPPTVVPVAQTPQDVEALARTVASKISSIRNEMIWKDLQRPGVLIRTVDGGYIVENRFGEEAVRMDLESTLQKAREWLSSPRV